MLNRVLVRLTSDCSNQRWTAAPFQMYSSVSVFEIGNAIAAVNAKFSQHGIRSAHDNVAVDNLAELQ